MPFAFRLWKAAPGHPIEGFPLRTADHHDAPFQPLGPRSGEIFGLRQSVNNALRVSAPMVFGFVATAFGLSLVFWLSALMMRGGGLVSPRRK